MKTKRSYNKAFPYRTITPITGNNTNSRLTHKNNNARNGTFARTFDHLINHYPPDEPVSKPFSEKYKDAGGVQLHTHSISPDRNHQLTERSAKDIKFILHKYTELVCRIHRVKKTINRRDLQ